MNILNFPGVYLIRNKVNGDSYLGSTKNMRLRKNRHFWRLRKGIQPNKILQAAFNEYGEENFEFVPLIVCDEFNLLMYEQVFLDKLQPTYNVRKIDVCSNKGVVASEETRKKMSEASSGRTYEFTDESRKRMESIWESNRGREVSEETRVRLSRSLKGKKRTEETKVKISLSQKGKKKHNEASIELISLNSGSALDWVGLVSPDGVEYRNIHNLSRFCTEHGLNYKCISRVAKGQRKQHNGWRLITE